MNYACIFEGLWLLLTAYWIITAFGTKRTVYRNDPRPRLVLLSLIAVLVWSFYRFPGYFNRRLFPYSELSSWIGIALCAAGVAFAIWARKTLGRNWSGNPSIKEDHELVESGPYRYARHPIYTGLLTAVLGTLVGGGRVRELIVFAGSLAIMWLKILIEEKLMMRQFPAAYPEYKRRTKALIPFLL